MSNYTVYGVEAAALLSRSHGMYMRSTNSGLSQSHATARTFVLILWFDQRLTHCLPLVSVLYIPEALLALVITQITTWLSNQIKNSKIALLDVWIGNLLPSFSWTSGFFSRVARKYSSLRVMGSLDLPFEKRYSL